MKRFVISTAAAAALLATMVPARATDVTSNFTVSVALTAICTATNSGTKTLDFGTYTAFQAGAATPGAIDLTFSCTRGLAAPTLSFDAAKGGNYGVLAGLNYSLTATNGTTTPGTGATAVNNGTGTADVLHVTVAGSMAGGQAGDCANSAASACATAVTDTRTLTVTY